MRLAAIKKADNSCPICGFTTDRDVASGLVIRNRGIKSISTDGQSGIEASTTLSFKSAYAVDLSGMEEKSTSRQEAKPRKGKTRKTK